uniref:Uncharacterized protein n=1 Tax=Anopheles arabiensis TaxID=7173 RepID=A0A182IGE1_ANOAR
MCPKSQSSCAASRSPPVYPHRQRHHHLARPAQQFTGSDITVAPVQRYQLSGPTARGTTAAPCSAAHRRPNGSSIRRAASRASSASGATTYDCGSCSGTNNNTNNNNTDTTAAATE